MLRLAFAFLLLSCGLSAQGADPPKYFVAAGAGWNHYSRPQASGWLTFGAQISGSNYGYSVLTMTSQHATMGAGYARLLASHDGFTLFGLGDMGIITGLGEVGGSFTGGSAVSYDISRWTKIPKTFAIVSVKVRKTTLNEVEPTFHFGVGMSW